MTDEIFLKSVCDEPGSLTYVLRYSVDPVFPTPHFCGQKAERSAHCASLDLARLCLAYLVDPAYLSLPCLLFSRHQAYRHDGYDSLANH